MEFNFNINNLFPDIITRLDARLATQNINYGSNKSNLFTAIDTMGADSTKAQGLSTIITSAKRLLNSDHSLYILKDPEVNYGKGALLGILKVGRKKLFVYDIQGQQHELDPLCVLDFYVHESRQRQGCGKLLFDFMLRQEQILPRHLAIDRPSQKFAGFLRKHYGLKDTIPQMNNFVVFTGFFRDRTDLLPPGKRRGRLAINGRPPLHPYPTDLSQKAPNQPEFTYNSCRSRPYSATYVPHQGSSAFTGGHIPSSRGDTVTNNRPSSSHHQNLPLELKQLSLEDSRKPSQQYSRYAIASNEVVQNGTRPAQMDNGRRPSTPPLLSREGPPKGYLGASPHHNGAITRLPDPSPPRPNQILRSAPAANRRGPLPLQNPRQGLTNNGYTYIAGVQRHYTHTRLW